MFGGRGTGTAAAACAAGAAACAAACAPGMAPGRPPEAAAGVPAAAAPAPRAAIAIEPAGGSRDVRPDRSVVVTAERGRLERVTVRADGAGVPAAGSMAADHRSWRTSWPLRPGAAYTVTSAGTDEHGARSGATSRFTTLRPAGTFRIAAVAPRPGETVGVGMPVIVTFDRPIARRAAVERALELRAGRRVTGAWRWVAPQQVVFRPRRYWPAHEHVTLVAHTMGVRSADGVYGAAGTVTSFDVGAARVSTVDTRRHRMSVRVGGRVVRTAPISAGKGGRRAYTTTSGVHLAMAKGDPVVMTSAWMGVTDKKDPRYYKLKVRHAVQISSSGEYVHSAPWSVRAQGKANVSHGCVNAPPAFARWFYAQSQRGDVVTVTGTSRALEWNNGWGYWQMSWSRWVSGSALGHPVRTRPAHR